MLQKDNLALIHASEDVSQLRGQGEEPQGYSKRDEGSSCGTASQMSNFAAGWSTLLPWAMCGQCVLAGVQHPRRSQWWAPRHTPTPAGTAGCFWKQSSPGTPWQGRVQQIGTQTRHPCETFPELPCSCFSVFYCCPRAVFLLLPPAG